MKKALGWTSRIAIAIAVFFGVFLGTASAASAAPMDTAQSVSGPVQMRMDEEPEKEERVYPVDEYVLMFRWVNGTQNFNYVTDGSPLSAMERGTQRTVFYTLPMAIGNGAWSGTSSLLDGAVQFKPMQLVSADIDQAAASIGEAIINSPLIAAAIVMASFGAIFALKKGESPWRRLLTTVGVAAMFAIMVAGAGSSTEVNGKYSPGTGSPGWFLTLVSNATTQITTSVAESLSTPQFEQTGGSISNCNAYTSVTLRIGSERRDAGNRTLPSTAPMSSYLWMQTGMKAWKMAQFGSNVHADRVYCHVLDWAYPNLAKETLNDSLYQDKGYPEVTNINSAAFSPGTREQFDRSGIAWAVCRPSSNGGFTVDDAWFNDNGKWGKGDTGQVLGGDTASYGPSKEEYIAEGGVCHKWWNDDAESWDSKPFYVGPNDRDIRKFLDNDLSGSKAGVYDFLTNWRGANNTGIIITNTYVFSSFIISGAFLIVTAAVFFVNIAVVVAMLSIFVVMLVVMFTKNEVGTRLGGFVKNLVGLIVFSAVAALLIAMLAKIVEVMSKLGESLFKDSPIAIMIWVGLSPLFALIMMHFVFTKLLKVPSPFKLSSALAWGAAAGAAGGAAGAGLAARGENAAERAAGRGIKKAGGALADKAKGVITGNKNEGRDGAASVTDSKTKGREAAGAENKALDGTELTAKEQRSERKQALAEAKAKRKEGAEEAKNDKFLSAADSLLGGGGGAMAATTGWRGFANKVSGAIGQGDILSEKNSLAADSRSLQERLSDGGMARSSSALAASKDILGTARQSLSDGFSNYAEQWHSDPRGAVAQTFKTTAKYGALAVGTAATGGLVGAAYAGVKTVQATRNAGYAGGSRQYRDQQVAAFQQRKQAQVQAQNKVRAESEKKQRLLEDARARQEARDQAFTESRQKRGGQGGSPGGDL